MNKAQRLAGLSESRPKVSTPLRHPFSDNIRMKCALACALAIAWWYLLYPPASQKEGPDSIASLSSWQNDGSYGTAADCDAAHLDDLNSMLGLMQNSRGREESRKAFLQTQAGRCIASVDPRLAR
jgi:hypothetical protein